MAAVSAVNLTDDLLLVLFVDDALLLPAISQRWYTLMAAVSAVKLTDDLHLISPSANTGRLPAVQCLGRVAFRNNTDGAHGEGITLLGSCPPPLREDFM